MAHLFVYGTLRPGEVRWHHLQRFIADDGHADTAVGHLFDTGLGYPAAMFPPPSGDGTATIHGHTFELAAASLDEALRHLDDVEGAVRGLYHRVEIVTGAGRTAWAYQYGADPADPAVAMTRIASGDWLTREAG